MAPSPDPLVAVRLVITEEVTEGDTTTCLVIEPADAPLVTVLGLLRLAEDTAIRTAMGEGDA